MASTLDKRVSKAFNRIKTGQSTNQDMKALLQGHLIHEQQRVTLPHERMRALRSAEQLLCDLLEPKQPPRVPKQVRQRARAVLRHWPMGSQLDLLSERIPELYNTVEDPLYCAVKRYSK